MSENDPFSDFEQNRTLIKPSPGRAARAASGAATPMPQTGAAPAATGLSAPDAMALLEVPGSTGQSALLQLAAPLLMAGARIRQMSQHANPAALRDALGESIRKFESGARARALSDQQVIAGRYLLCTFIDECASSTPWGGSGAWASQSLLVAFHNESWGGEKLFQLLAKLNDNVPANRDLLELIYVILALGLEGRYRVLPEGRQQLDAVREQLGLALRAQRGAAAADLSPRWVGVPPLARRLRDGVPVWLVATLAALLLALIFIALRIVMAGHTDEVFGSLQALDVKAAPVAVAAPTPAAPVAPRLSGFLKPEIDAGLVAVRDLPDRSIITIQGDGLFASGSADLDTRVLPLLNRIGQELARIPGPVMVSGHSDNQPIRSIRYPSNWQLSTERALSVREILATQVSPERIRSEGLADSQPQADNATPSGRARNRRVEITLLVAQAN
jgi:type VI secretion system protein ImpK